MGRPTYETEADRGREKAVMEAVAKRFGGRLLKSQPFERYDYSISKEDGSYAYFEVKCRTFPRQKYPTALLSFNKYSNLVDVHIESGGSPVFLVYSWSDGICVFQVNPIDLELFEVKRGGRYDRNDPMDIENVIHIPVDQFTPLDKAFNNDNNG